MDLGQDDRKRGVAIDLKGPEWKGPSSLLEDPVKLGKRRSAHPASPTTLTPPTPGFDSISTVINATGEYDEVFIKVARNEIEALHL